MHNHSRLRTLFPPGLANQPWTAERVAAYLLPLSTFYLALPHLIFFFGWLQWPWALLATASVGVALFVTLRWAISVVPESGEMESNEAEEAMPLSLPEEPLPDSQADAETPSVAQAKEKGEEGFVFTRQHALMIGAICLMWLTTSGAGGFVFQDFDWVKHNTVLNSLIRKPWPTVYEIYQVNVPLVYYIGYYLPAALFGKVGGWFWANQALFAWSWLGLMMAMLWFCILVRRVSLPLLLIFIFFSGLDIVGKWLASYYSMWNANLTTWQHIDAWTGLWQYSANATLLNWVPHHALSGWIATGMILYCLVILRRREVILLPVGLSAFWSPFITLGLIPYLVLDFLIAKESWSERIRRMITIPNAVGLLALAITGFYFSAKLYDGLPIAIQDMFSGLSIDQYQGPTQDAIAFLVFFCLLEFGLYVIILYRSGAVQEERWRWMFDITVLTLCILPWFKLGVFNDLVMRASIPALFVLAVIVARAIYDRSLERQTRVALLVVLLAGAFTSGIELRRHLEWMTTTPAPIFDEENVPHDLIQYTKDYVFYLGQYSGSIDAPFFRYAAKAIPEGAKAEVGSDEYALNDHDFIFYGQHLYLLRDSVKVPEQIEAGSTFTVPWQLHFFGPSFNGRQTDPLLRFVDEDGVPVWETNSWPEGRPKVPAFSMTEWSGMMTVTVPITATPGVYNLEVGFIEVGQEEPLIAHSVPQGEPIGEIVPVGATEVIKDD